jgi:hypothetical protein
MEDEHVFDKEQAEGERQTVNETLGESEAQRTGKSRPVDGRRQGITNKPAAEEERQQEKLPPRGEAKS